MSSPQITTVYSADKPPIPPRGLPPPVPQRQISTREGNNNYGINIQDSVDHWNTQQIKMEAPPLPATLPPVGCTLSYASGSNINNNNSGGKMRSTTWHSQTHSVGLNNNLSNQMLTNNNFLDNERAASAGWGVTRFDANSRPLSLQHDISSSRISAESSSESEAHSTISTGSKEKKSGVFRMFRMNKKRSSQPN
ncbi:uncharacterized protein LOC116351612 isoform X2 [Contarinia nasturtii]|uniref:uncharacterized protein LOC116351612 isoform X2 n=1 Tax=Contarinia nasturtii TaxID=265458 RepID=UPI0012D40383|nr:uncharacterized protein LOC116351612 isoform X2 [Contarinia nasturtii]